KRCLLEQLCSSTMLRHLINPRLISEAAKEQNETPVRGPNGVTIAGPWWHIGYGLSSIFPYLLDVNAVGISRVRASPGKGHSFAVGRQSGHIFQPGISSQWRHAGIW